MHGASPAADHAASHEPTFEAAAPAIADSPQGPDPEDAARPRRLLRINEVAAELGLTTRAIRYWEEFGLCAPVARSGGAYRLYDETAVRRLRFIRSLREAAGFSLSEIGQLLEEEVARDERRVAFHAATDPQEKRRLLQAALAAVDRQRDTLRGKVERLEAMLDEVDRRRSELLTLLAAFDDEPNR